jgi:hypothetical protein
MQPACSATEQAQPQAGYGSAQARGSSQNTPNQHKWASSGCSRCNGRLEWVRICQLCTAVHCNTICMRGQRWKFLRENMTMYRLQSGFSAKVLGVICLRPALRCSQHLAGDIPRFLNPVTLQLPFAQAHVHVEQTRIFQRCPHNLSMKVSYYTMVHRPAQRTGCTVEAGATTCWYQQHAPFGAAYTSDTTMCTTDDSQHCRGTHSILLASN